jgi:tubulin monoglycylase TTLL3/8
VQSRKNSCQLFGYDFLIDDQLGVWLLEVNASPTMEPSTAVTERLCAQVQVGLAPAGA